VTAYLAPSLVALRDEVNRRWPNRDRGSDGWIGDTAHSARVSDHNPDERGMVHAIDVDKDGIDVDRFLSETIGDARVWYVIHNRTIWSRTYDWKPRAYTGSNPHEHHIHVSIRYTGEAETDTRSWFGIPDKPRTRGLPTLTADRVIEAAKLSADGKRPGRRGSVTLVQSALNERLGLRGADRLDTDGRWGPSTARAYREAQRQRRWKVTGIPTRDQLRGIGRGRFKVV